MQIEEARIPRFPAQPCQAWPRDSGRTAVSPMIGNPSHWRGLRLGEHHRITAMPVVISAMRSQRHAPADYGRAFAIGIGLNLAYVAAEAGFGSVAGSLALLADAGHNLGDVLGLALSWGAAVLSRRQPEPVASPTASDPARSSPRWPTRSILLVVTGGIAWEAVRRLAHPVPVAGGIVAWVAAVGILVNGGTALLFAGGRRRDLNVKSAFLHMAADALVTAGVVVDRHRDRADRARLARPGGQPGRLGGHRLRHLGFAARLRFASRSTRCRTASTPRRCAPISPPSRASSAIHDLHIWGMSTTETALTCHLVMPAGHPGRRRARPHRARTGAAASASTTRRSRSSSATATRSAR